MAEASTETVLPMNGRNRRSSRWYPLDVFEAVQDEMDRFWRQLSLKSPRSPKSQFRRGGWPATAWSPRNDVFKKDDTVTVNAELPGLKKQDVQIELTDAALVIRSESKAESERKAKQYCHAERSVGTFYRQLVSFEANADQIQATMTDGVLEVRISRPTAMEPEPHRIPAS